MKKNIVIFSFLFVASLVAEDSLIVKQAKGFGFTHCISAVQEIEDFFGDNTSYGTWTVAAKKNTNNNLLSATMELTYSDGSQLANFIIMPNSNKTCTYAYTRTWYSELSCMKTSRGDLLKGYEFKGELNKNISIFQNKDNVRIFLSPTANGCLIQKQEVAYNWKNQDK